MFPKMPPRTLRRKGLLLAIHHSLDHIPEQRGSKSGRARKSFTVGGQASSRALSQEGFSCLVEVSCSPDYQCQPRAGH